MCIKMKGQIFSFSSVVIRFDCDQIIDSIDRLINNFIPYNLYGEDTWMALSTVDFNRLLYPSEQIRKWDRETAWPNRFSAPDNG